MANGLVFGDDERVAMWTYHTFSKYPMTYDRAVGVVDGFGNLVGAFLLHGFNGYNINLSYYGPKTVTLGIVRMIARVVLTEFNASRCSLVTSKKRKHLISSLHKIGWRLEGSHRRYFGHEDTQRNTAIELVMFREQIELLAAMQPESKKVAVQ